METRNLAALIGAAITVAVVVWSLASDSAMTSFLVLIALPAFLVTAFPTFAIYTALAAAVMRLVARRDAVAAAALLAALVPFAFWATSLSSVLRAKAEERAEIAAIPKAALPAKVSAVVIDGENGGSMNCARMAVLSGDVDFSDVLTHGQSRSPYLRFTRATLKAPVNRGEPADSAPAEHLLIHFPRRPDFLKSSRMPPGQFVTIGGNLHCRCWRNAACRGDLYRPQPASVFPADADDLRLVPRQQLLDLRDNRATASALSFNVNCSTSCAPPTVESDKTGCQSLALSPPTDMLR